MKRVQTRLAWYVALLSLLAGAGARAGPIATWGSALVNIQVGDYFDIAATGIGTETRLSFDDGQGYTALARAHSDYGINRVFVATKNTADPDTPVFAEALSVWNERLLVSGGHGTAHGSITVRLSGAISSQGPNLSAPLLSYSLLYQPEGGVTPSQMAILWNSDSQLSEGLGVIAPRDLLGEFTFEYDQPFILYGTLRANVAGNAVIDAFHSAVVTNTAFPRGTLVVNDGGETVRAALHFDAVPEPGSLALVFFALMLMTLLAGRRTSPLRLASLRAGLQPRD